MLLLLMKLVQFVLEEYQTIFQDILMVSFGILPVQIVMMLVVMKKMMKRIRKTYIMMRIFRLITMEVMEK